MSQYFGTNGVRGLFVDLDPALAMNLSQAIGMYFKRGKILVARDGRLTGECLKHAVLAGLQSVGCSTIDLDYAPAPTAEYMIKKLKADGLIIITASHNPAEWNALKVVDSKGISISSERGQEIENLIPSMKLVSWDNVNPGITYESAISEHIDAIINLIDSDKIKNKKPKLVLDCGNGMSVLIAPKLFKTLNCELVTLNSHVDGRFPGRPSEPTEENVRGLIEAVKSEKADAGIAWDGDSDRVIFVDEKGNYIIGDKVFALCVLWRLSVEKGSIASTVATSKAAEDIALTLDAGNQTHYTRIGAPYLSERVESMSLVLAGEEVGGVIFPELSLAKDGLMTAAFMVEAICEKPLSEWLTQVPKYFNAKARIDAATKEEKQEIVERVRLETVNRKLNTIEVDGIRADFEDSWFICRGSGTENAVRLFAEAKTEKKAKELLAEWKKIAEGK